MPRPSLPEAERREQVGVKLPRTLIERLDRYCSGQPAVPTRTAVIEAAIEMFLERHERPNRKRG